MNFKSFTCLFGFTFLLFSACTQRENYAGKESSEQIEPQPIVISGKNAFSLENGSVECGYRAKTVNNYSLFCNAYVDSNAKSLQPGQVKSLSALASISSSQTLATEFAVGVSIDWKVPVITSVSSPLSSQVCRVVNNGLGYVCDLVFTDAIVSFTELKFEVSAEVNDSTSQQSAIKKHETDIRNPDEVVEDAVVEKAGEDVKVFLSASDLDADEKEEIVRQKEVSDLNILNSAVIRCSEPPELQLNPLYYQPSCGIFVGGANIKTLLPALNINWTPFAFTDGTHLSGLVGDCDVNGSNSYYCTVQRLAPKQYEETVLKGDMVAVLTLGPNTITLKQNTPHTFTAVPNPIGSSGTKEFRCKQVTASSSQERAAKCVLYVNNYPATGFATGFIPTFTFDAYTTTSLDYVSSTLSTDSLSKTYTFKIKTNVSTTADKSATFFATIRDNSLTGMTAYTHTAKVTVVFTELP